VTRVLLLRHGETDWNATGRLQGSTDVPMNARGLEQAGAAARALGARLPKETVIVSSPLVRARATAEALAAVTGATIAYDDRMKERSYGAWEGMTAAEREEHDPVEVARWHLGLEPRIEGYEDHVSVTSRAVACIEEHATDGAVVVFVGHGSTSRLAVRTLMSLPLDGWNIGPLGNASWAEFERASDGEWRLLSYNIGA
jgi:broad specificity phosphatase PhoE